MIWKNIGIYGKFLTGIGGDADLRLGHDSRGAGVLLARFHQRAGCLNP